MGAKLAETHSEVWQIMESSTFRLTSRKPSWINELRALRVFDPLIQGSCSCVTILSLYVLEAYSKSLLRGNCQSWSCL